MKSNFIGKNCIIRSSSMGVFFGEIKDINDDLGAVLFTKCRRIWYWEGAASISQIANDGLSNGIESRLPAETANHLVNGVGEIIELTETALSNLNSVPVWSI